MFIPRDTYEKKCVVSNRTIIYKKYNQDNLEISMHVLKPGATFYFLPPEDPSGTKVLFIVKGRLLHITSGQILSEFDTIILKHDDDFFLYDPLEECHLYLNSFGDHVYEQAKANFSTINTSMEKIQLKDDYTNKHCLRVHALAKEMASKLKLTGKETYSFLTAARYHDIGKINISIDILNKPTSLTSEEFITMKRHVSEGYEHLPTLHTKIIPMIISEHHERLDGSGYPKGLKAENISELGKALAVIDTFDAMTTDRVYKKGKSVENAFEELYSLADVTYKRKYIELLEEIIHEDSDLLHRLRTL